MLEQLAIKLQQLGYTGDFFALNISVAEAFRQQVEATNRENNEKVMKLLKDENFTRIMG